MSLQFIDDRSELGDPAMAPVALPVCENAEVKAESHKKPVVRGEALSTVSTGLTVVQMSDYSVDHS